MTNQTRTILAAYFATDKNTITKSKKIMTNFIKLSEETTAEIETRFRGPSKPERFAQLVHPDHVTDCNLVMSKVQTKFDLLRAQLTAKEISGSEEFKLLSDYIKSVAKNGVVVKNTITEILFLKQEYEAKALSLSMYEVKRLYEAIEELGWVALSPDEFAERILYSFYPDC